MWRRIIGLSPEDNYYYDINELNQFYYTHCIANCPIQLESYLVENSNLSVVDPFYILLVYWYSLWCYCDWWVQSRNKLTWNAFLKLVNSSCQWLHSLLSDRQETIPKINVQRIPRQRPSASRPSSLHVYGVPVYVPTWVQFTWYSQLMHIIVHLSFVLHFSSRSQSGYKLNRRTF